MSPDPTPEDLVPDDVIQVAESTWAVYGHSTYDGEVIIGEYHELSEARTALEGDGGDVVT